jgi:hypothetical protein
MDCIVLFRYNPNLNSSNKLQCSSPPPPPVPNIVEPPQVVPDISYMNKQIQATAHSSVYFVLKMHVLNLILIFHSLDRLKESVHLPEPFATFRNKLDLIVSY